MSTSADNVTVFYLRFILTLPLLIGLLAAAVLSAGYWTWRYDPLAPCGTLVAPDQVALAGRQRNMQANLVPLTSGLPRGGWPVVVHVPQAGQLRQAVAIHRAGFCHHKLTADPRHAQVRAQFRLSPEFGLGPLRVVGTLFVIRPDEKIVVFDLEGIATAGRYDLGPANRQRVRRLMTDNVRPIYLADVSFAEYNRLRAELEQADWPAGPLVMWRNWTYQAAGRAPTRAETVGDLQNRFPSRLLLAVVADLKDNRDPFGRAVKVVSWDQLE